MKEKLEISFSPQTIYTIIFIGLGIFIVWKLSDILILMLTAMMCAAALNPGVAWLEKKKIPQTAAAAIIVFALFLPLIYVSIAILPTFFSQLPGIFKTISNTLNSYGFLPEQLRNFDLVSYFQNSNIDLIKSTTKITGFFFQAITLIFMIFYMLADGDHLHKLIASVIPSRNRKKIEKISSEMSRISGQYIRGNLVISLICSLTILAGLLILNIPYALPLAILAGVLDLLPLIGSTIGAIPAIIIGFTISPLKGFLVIALFIIYQEIENDVIAPHIYKQVLKLIPFLSFVSVIIGALLFGIPGAFLALPIAASVPTVLNYFKLNAKN